MPQGEAFGNRAAVRFGSAGDVRAVAVDDTRELHRPGPRRAGRESRIGAAQRVHVLPQAGVLDSERFKAGEQREVHLVLPPEVLPGVLGTASGSAGAARVS